MFHLFIMLIATSLGMAEGMLKYGFENSLDILTDQRNWNLKYLGGSEDACRTNHLPEQASFIRV